MAVCALGEKKRYKWPSLPSSDAVCVGEGLKLFSAITGAGKPHERSANELFRQLSNQHCLGRYYRTILAHHSGGVFD